MAISDSKHSVLKDIYAEVSKVVIGKDEMKELLLVALLSEGHVLIEGLPGTAKTTITRTFARAIGGKFKRVQGTPDMLPSDILGFYLYQPDGSSRFMPGPIFANVVLFDELNRTTPRTQSAFLEAMQERQVTIERETHSLERPFVVIASQVPYGGPGTSPLSEVQIDRFMFRIWSALPSLEEEDRVLQNIDAISEPTVSAVITPERIIQLQQAAKKVHVADSIRQYILAILDRLRHNQDLLFGPSPRAGIALFKGARGLAYIQGRDFVIPDDVKRLLIPTLSHRVRVSAEAEMDNVTPEAVINRIADEVAVPKEGQKVVAQSVKKDEIKAAAVETKVAIQAPDASGVAASAGNCEAEETPAEGDKAPRAAGFSFRTLSDLEWLLLIGALALGVVMVTVGMMLLR